MTKKIILKTKQELVNYYLNRNFSEIKFQTILEMETAEIGEIEIEYISEEYYWKKFSIGRKDCKAINSFDNLEIENKELWEEFENWTKEQGQLNYPINETVFRIRGGYMRTSFFKDHIDELAEIGMGLFEFNEECYLFIARSKYDLYNDHFIPLFNKFFNWTEKDCEQELKTRIIVYILTKTDFENKKIIINVYKDEDTATMEQLNKQANNTTDIIKIEEFELIEQ